MAKSALERLAAVATTAFENHEPRPNAAFIVDNVEIIDRSNRRLDWPVLDALESLPMNWTITGASSVELVCEDPHGELLNDPLFAKWMFQKTQVSKSSAKNYTGRKITDSSKTARYGEESEEEWILPSHPIDLNLDGVWFRLAGFRTNETKLTLIFEDRVAAILRAERGQVIVAERGKLTRAEFIQQLARLAEHNHREYGRIPVFAPEAHIHQREATVETESASDLKQGTARALAANEGVTLEGQPADQEQLQVLNEALQTAVELKAPFKAQVALVEAVIQEEKARNLPEAQKHPNTSQEAGVLNVTKETAASLGIKNRLSVQEVCTVFLKQGFTGRGGAINLVKSLSHLSAGEIAQLVQGSAFGGEETYGKHREEAEGIVRKYGAVEGTTAREVTHPAPYQFTRGPVETSWDCIQRLASEVSWYAFVRDNQLWYVSGDYLLAQQPKVKVVRGEEGVDWVDPNIDIGARDNIAEIAVMGRAPLWSALPGMCVSVGRVGPANGRWVVNTIKQDLLDRSNKVDIKLQKPLPARPEPAATGTTTTEEQVGLAGAPSKSALAAFNAASTLSSQNLSYVFGGGHGPGVLEKSRPGEGLDCSSSTCWILHQAGMFPSSQAVVSGELAKSWGVPGEGKEMTVWANAEHVWIEFKIPGHAHARADTVPDEKYTENGPRLRSFWPPPEGTSGFTPRHWPGT